MATRKRKSDDQLDNDSSSDDSSTIGRNVPGEGSEQATAAAGTAYFGSRVASVCNEINAQAERSMSPFERLMLKKRRETNRLSAQRCRKRRREEIKQLETQKQILQTETALLEAEKARLQGVLQQEIAISSSQNRFGHGINLLDNVPPISLADPISLSWWLQQRRRMNFYPGNLASTLDSSRASLMQLPARFDNNSLGLLPETLNFANRQGFQSPTQPTSLTPMDMLNLLPLVQARQDALSSMPATPNPWLLPQALATSNPGDNEASSLLTAIRNNQLGLRIEEEAKMRTGDSTDGNELHINRTESKVSYQTDAKDTQR